MQNTVNTDPGDDANAESNVDTDADKNQFFWQTKSLADLSQTEWESLCDGCARCCLLKLEDIDSHKIYYTSVNCKLLDIKKCQCTQYPLRSKLVPDCVTLTPDNLEELAWMPSTCAYRLVSEGKPLPDWHPLVSGDKEIVHTAGISIRSYAVSEETIKPKAVQEFIVDWLD